MPYSEAFPYAQGTERLIQQFPPWMAARRRRDSNLQQYLNAIGLEIDELQDDAQALWNQVFIGTLDPDTPAWLQKAVYPGESLTITGFSGHQSFALEPVERLRDFLRSDGHVYIIDKEQRTIYFRQRYDEVRINHQPVALQDHHLWNSFDEFAFRAGLRRHRLETNEELRKRTLYAFRHPHGVAAPLANFIGLLAEKEWPTSTPALSLDESHILVDTIRINDRPVLPGQVVGNMLVPQVEPLATDGQHDGTALLSEVLVLQEGALEGTFVSALLSPGNLGLWDFIEIEGDFLPHQVHIDLLPAYYESGGEVRPVVSGINASQPFAHDPEGPSLAQPVFVRVRMRRKKHEAPPRLTLLRLGYEHRDRVAAGEEPAVPSVVQYLFGVKVEHLHDPQVKAELMQELEDARREGGYPYLLQLIDELASAIPVLWDQFIWDEGYWDIYERNLVGLDTLDSPWNTTLAGIRHLQPGIGHGEDVLTTHKDWRLVSQPGVYFSGPDLEAHYLFANPRRTVVSQPLGPIPIPAGAPGTPVVIKAAKGQETRYLTQVCFLDDMLTPSVANAEVLTGLGRSYVSATYADLDIESVVVEGYTVDTDAYDGTDRIPLTAVVPEGDTVTVLYKLRDSFALMAEGDQWIVELSDAYDHVEIVTEGGTERIHSRTLDPAATHLRTGFVYLDAPHAEHPPAKLRLRVTPLTVLGDGHSRALVTLDVLDRWDNPVYLGFGQEPMLSVIGSGSIAFVEADANRFHYQYTSGITQGDDQEALIQATLGELEASVALVVKGVSMD